MGSKWSTWKEAKKTAEEYIISRGKSWKHYKAYKPYWVRICKNRTEYDFRIRFNITSAGLVELTILTPHTFPNTTNAKSWLWHSILFLSSNQQSCGVVEEDQNVKHKQLMIKKWLDRGNEINYQ